MIIEIKIDTGNAAFQGNDRNPEIQRILADVISELETISNNTVDAYIPLKDINGNYVGYVKILDGSLTREDCIEAWNK